jgi:hypothetical protein
MASSAKTQRVRAMAARIASETVRTTDHSTVKNG